MAARHGAPGLDIPLEAQMVYRIYSLIKQTPNFPHKKKKIVFFFLLLSAEFVA